MNLIDPPDTSNGYISRQGVREDHSDPTRTINLAKWVVTAPYTDENEEISPPNKKIRTLTVNCDRNFGTTTSILRQTLLRHVKIIFPKYFCLNYPREKAIFQQVRSTGRDRGRRETRGPAGEADRRAGCGASGETTRCAAGLATDGAGRAVDGWCGCPQARAGWCDGARSPRGVPFGGGVAGGHAAARAGAAETWGWRRSGSLKC